MSKILPSVVCSRRGQARLCAVDVPADLQALVVERTVCPHSNPECRCLPAISVVCGIDGDGVEQALTDFGGCVEAAYGDLLSGAHLQATLERGGLYMALSTATAYSVAPAQHFCKVLAERLQIDERLRDAIELALHEAVVNGLLHGNLEIGSDDRRTLEGFRAFSATIGARLGDPSFAARAIEISAVPRDGAIEVSVADSGEGYDPAQLDLSDDPARTSGRGLALIRHLAQAVRLEEGGRTLVMRFAR